MELHEFEINVARALLITNPKRLDALQMLASALAKAGRFDEALAVDRKILQIAPKDPTAHYNLARSYSNLNDMDRAFEALEKAFECGYRDYKGLLRDRHLENVRRDPRFQKFLNKRWGKRQSSK